MFLYNTRTAPAQDNTLDNRRLTNLVSGRDHRCFLLVWLNHVRMMVGFFDYGYNGKFNAVFVITMVPLWVLWWLRVRRQRR